MSHTGVMKIVANETRSLTWILRTHTDCQVFFGEFMMPVFLTDHESSFKTGCFSITGD